MNYIFPPRQQPSIPVIGSNGLYPVNRVFCVGRNYEAHAIEMGHQPDREAPFYFMKDASSIVFTGRTIPYALETGNLHFEMEFVVAIEKDAFRISTEDALSVVFGYACGLDMTRRDIQNDAKAKGRPWDLGKNFENAAVIGPITPKSEFGAIANQRIHLSLNGAIVQDQNLSDLIWTVPELIAHLSRYYHLKAGDLIYTGTPAGVGPVKSGDLLIGNIDGLAPVEVTFSQAE